MSQYFENSWLKVNFPFACFFRAAYLKIEITLRSASHLKTKHETVLKQYMTTSENIKIYWTAIEVFQL